MNKQEYIQSLKEFYLNDGFDLDKYVSSINKMYEKAGHKSPKFYFMYNTPLHFEYAFRIIKLLLEEINGQGYWKTFPEQNWIFLKEKIIKNPGFRVENKEQWEKTCEMTCNQLKEQVKSLTVIPLELGDDVNGVIYRSNQQEVIYDMLPSYLNTIKDEIHNINFMINKKQKVNMTNNYIHAFQFSELRNGGVNNLICYENVCLISRPPQFIKINDQEQLDCKSDYALYWDDSFGKYYVRGVNFDEDLFVKAFKLKTLAADELMAVENVEQKAVLIDEYGYDFIKSKLKNLKVLDTHHTVSKITGRETYYELFEYDFPINNSWSRTLRLRIIQVECHTTHHKTFLGVPRQNDTNDCMSAIAWTFGLTKQEYQPIAES